MMKNIGIIGVWGGTLQLLAFIEKNGYCAEQCKKKPMVRNSESISIYGKQT
jgi:hypothetical protein